MKGPDRLYAGYLFDLDGTIYLGDELLPGAAQLIEELRAHGRGIIFLSNNPTKNRTMYAEKLTDLGLPTKAEDVVNSVFALTRWLAQEHSGATVYPIGEEPLEAALHDAGIPISQDPTRIDFVVASYDRTFTYDKLQIAFDAIWFHKRARLIATNPDRYCPFPGGRGEPDAAAITAAIEACTGTRCEATAGKPNPLMAEIACQQLNLDPAECLMTGDRLSTDVQLGVNAGMDTAVVLTGETTAEMLRDLGGEQRPTWVLERLDDLLPEGS